ncbi:MAG: hypothetical protein KKA19_05755, partial [Candidatus Margulisbacteria bacterium]|nr:hypothetical protein [Candidatus Margulisiibacteriota bacterium]
KEKEKVKKKLIRNIFSLLAILALNLGCTQLPKGCIEDYDLGPIFSPASKYVSYTRVLFEDGKITKSFLKLHNLNNGDVFTIAGPLEDFIWHPLEGMFYFISGYTLYEANPDNFNRRAIYSFNYRPAGKISIFGWLDGQTLILKQDLSEVRPSGSYCVLYDIQSYQITSRYFIKDEDWPKMPSGNQYKLTKTTNQKISLLKDGKYLTAAQIKFPIPQAKDYYSLEIQYGNMLYEMPLMAGGNFYKFKPFWDVEKNRIFFSSNNYFWRIDIEDLKLIRLGLTKDVQKGIKREWQAATWENPEVYILKEEQTVEQKVPTENKQKSLIKAFFIADDLIVERNEQRNSINIEVKPELKALHKKYSIIDFSANGDKIVFSHGGRIGYINLINFNNLFLSDEPRIISKEYPAK